MRVNEAVVELLSEHGISTVFGNPGKQSLPLNKAIDERTDIEFVIARHETAVSHEAWGYAETSGEMAALGCAAGAGGRGGRWRALGGRGGRRGRRGGLLPIPGQCSGRMLRERR